MDTFERLAAPRIEQGLLPVLFDDYYIRECLSQADDLLQYARDGFIGLGLGSEEKADQFARALVESSSKAAIDTMWIYFLPE
jgi:hypothetical protein